MARAKEEKDKPVKMSDEAVVRSWLTSATIAEAAESLGVKQSSLQVRVARLRSLGVNLPKKKRQAIPVDVAALNKLINNLSK